MALGFNTFDQLNYEQKVNHCNSNDFFSAWPYRNLRWKHWTEIKSYNVDTSTFTMSFNAIKLEQNESTEIYLDVTFDKIFWYKGNVLNGRQTSRTVIIG